MQDKHSTTMTGHGILINGNFLCRPLTGIERFAYETVSAMDKITSNSDDIALLAPSNAVVPQYNNIITIRSNRPLRSFPLWDMGTFARECGKNRRVGLSFSNTAPLGRRCGLAFVHDVYAAEHREDFRTAREVAVSLYTQLHCRNIARYARRILTVSHFSAERIASVYHVHKERITVVTNGWEHFMRIAPDDSVFDRLPLVQRGAFYFTLGSLQKRKNLRFILHIALSHPQDTFVISGGSVSGYVTGELSALENTSNIILTGRLSDEEVKAMMTHCKAFLFPSLYEGFGIPPLEALSVGAKVIVSDIPVFHEIFGDAVHYVDPHNTECNIDGILRRPTSGAAEVLAAHTYQKAAEVLLNVIRGA